MIKKYLFSLVIIHFAFFSNAQVMTEIGAGSFTMGNASYARENPIRTVSVSRFYLSKHHVTNAQFAAFLNTYGSDTIKTGEFIGKPIFLEDSWGIVRENGTWKPAIGYESFPMIKVTWYGANEFCRDAGGRLPT